MSLLKNEGNRNRFALIINDRRIDITPRRDDPIAGTTFVAQKRQDPPLRAPANANSVGRFKLEEVLGTRASWLAIPGKTHLPVESNWQFHQQPMHLATSANVFSGRTSLSLGDEDDWWMRMMIFPAFCGRFRPKCRFRPSSSSTFGHLILESPMTLSPPPRETLQSIQYQNGQRIENPSLNSANAPQ